MLRTQWALALRNKVEAPAVLSEPDLDFTRLTSNAANGGQVKMHGRLSDDQHIVAQSTPPRFERARRARSRVGAGAPRKRSPSLWRGFGRQSRMDTETTSLADRPNQSLFYRL
jgi:hypothetical protein